MLAYLRKLFNWSMESDLIAANPCAGIKPRATEKSRDRVLNDAELKALWRAAEAMKGQFGPIVQLLILTGQRREEVGGNAVERGRTSTKALDIAAPAE